MKALDRAPKSRYADVLVFSETLSLALLATDAIDAGEGSESGNGFFGKVKGLFRRD